MSDRRKSGQRDVTDRRIIERFTNVKIRQNFKHIHSWLRTLMFLSFFSALYNIGYGFYKGGHELGIGLLFGALLIFMSSYLYRYQAQIHLFLENDSIKNLENTLEKAQSLWTVIVFFSVLYLIISISSHF